MIAGHALRVSDPGQTLAFDHAMAPVLALCGVVQNGTVLMLKAPADWAIVSRRLRQHEPPVRLWALKPHRLEETNAEFSTSGRAIGLCQTRFERLGG